MLINIELLKNNKLNSNFMPEEIRYKLFENLKDGGKYPPIIVRKISEPPTEFDIRNSEREQESIRILKKKWGDAIRDNPRRSNEILLKRGL
jgi:hypothetical protein